MRLQVLVVVLLMTGCPGPKLPCADGACGVDAGASVDAGSEGVDAGGPGADAGTTVDAGLPAFESEAECAHLRGGPSAPATAVQLAEAHGAVRFFGPFTLYSRSDDALAAALNTPGPIDESVLIAYGRALPGVCVVRADDTGLPAARVELRGTVAVVRPGSGSLALPAGVTAIALDLRGLPARPELQAALEQALRLILQMPLPRAERQVRVHSGASDESPQQNVYSNDMGPLMLPPWPGEATAKLPLAVLTDEPMAPLVAEVAGSLRLTNRAWLFGAPVSASVAESSWQAMGSLGLGYRSKNLLHLNLPWPDAVSADVDAAGLDAALTTLASRGEPTATSGSLSREALQAIDSTGRASSAALTRGSARAALITLHATMRRFFPYFAVVGDGIDGRLVETLGSLEDAGVPTRQQALNAARRFGEVIRDGHNFVDDTSGALQAVGFFAVLVDHLDAGPTIVRSLTPGVNAGDVITNIAGVPADDWYAAELQRTSAATRGYQLSLASSRYTELNGPTAFGLRAPDGGTRTVTVSPTSWQVAQQLYQSGAHARRLAAEGAPDLEYINLDASGLDATHTCAAALTEAQGASGVILDMRGYPGSEGFECVARFAQSRMYSPRFRVPVWSGPESFQWVDLESWFLDPVAPGFAGPVVLLVGPSTVSAAETVSTMLVDAHRVKAVVGRQSAATNGNITYTRVPGGISYSFTGMQVLHTDGGVYHGQGIVPDIEVLPTVDDIVNGRDPVVAAAIAAVRAP